MADFSRQDTIGSFQFFIENFEFRYENYNFYALLKIFLKYIYADIRQNFDKNERDEVIDTIKKHIFGYYRNIDFQTSYNKEQIIKIVLG